MSFQQKATGGVHHWRFYRAGGADQVRIDSGADILRIGDLDQKLFLDSLAFAHMKPVFRGYEEWAGVIGDGLIPVFDGDAPLEATLDEVVTAADEVLAKNK